MCRCRDVRMLVMMSLLPGWVASGEGGEFEGGSILDFGIEDTLPSGVHPGLERRRVARRISSCPLRARP